MTTIEGRFNISNYLFKPMRRNTMSKQRTKSSAKTLHATVDDTVQVAEDVTCQQPCRQVVEANTTQQECRKHGGVSFEEAVKVRAYQLWEHAGRPEGDGISFWLEAESELSMC
jgi:hypothetical protein